MFEKIGDIIFLILFLKESFVCRWFGGLFFRNFFLFFGLNCLCVIFDFLCLFLFFLDVKDWVKCICGEIFFINFNFLSVFSIFLCCDFFIFSNVKFVGKVDVGLLCFNYC